MVNDCYLWLWKFIIGFVLLLIVIEYYLWLCMVIDGYVWLMTVTHGYGWLSLVMYSTNCY